MNSIALLFVVATIPSEASTSEALFTKLDRDDDGKIGANEITESQRSFFKRALRVADQNEDGALSSDELTAALTDPKPVQLPGVNAGGGRLAGLYSDKKKSDKQKPEMKKSELPEIMSSDARKTPGGAAREEVRAMMQRIDSNGNGKIDKDELPPRMKQFAQQMDSDNDGKIDASELAAAIKRRDGGK